jgi:hypothetical protein
MGLSDRSCKCHNRHSNAHRVSLLYCTNYKDARNLTITTTKYNTQRNQTKPKTKPKRNEKKIQIKSSYIAAYTIYYKSDGQFLSLFFFPPDLSVYTSCVSF